MVTRRLWLAVVVWGLRFAALGIFALWFIPTRQYETTENSERTYFGLGWPEHWLASEVTLTFRPTVSSEGVWSFEYMRRGPLTAWDPKPHSTGIGDAFTYRRWKRESPLLYGPIWQTAIGVVFLFVASYLNQYRRQPLAKASTPLQAARGSA